MTRKIEEVLGIPSMSEMADMPEAQELIATAEAISESIDIDERINSALSEVNDLGQHDREMDEIAQKALTAYQDLCDLGLNVADGHTARLFEVAATMLKTAMEAKDAKVNRKLKTIELQLKKARLDKDVGGGLSPEENSREGLHDRNDILNYIKAGIKEANIISENKT